LDAANAIEKPLLLVDEPCHALRCNVIEPKIIGFAGCLGWRASDSLSIRSFVRIALDESVPDHSTISRTRRLMDVETHKAVFQCVLAVLAEKKLG
jgi:hypothetical protein